METTASVRMTLEELIIVSIGLIRYDPNTAQDPDEAKRIAASAAKKLRHAVVRLEQAPV